MQIEGDLIASVGFQLGLALDDGAFRGAMKRSSKYDFLRTSTARSADQRLTAFGSLGGWSIS